MGEHDVYEIRTVEDFLRVPVEKREQCLEDFSMWLNVVQEKHELHGLIDAIAGVRNAAKMRTDVFQWVDDGKRGVSDITINGESVRQYGEEGGQ